MHNDHAANMSQVLVTGGGGFIGSHTVDYLIQEGFNVRVLDNLEPQVHGMREFKYRNEKAEYQIGDIRFKKHWRKAINDVDFIVHLAGAVGIAQSFWQVKKYMDVNSIGTSNLYQLLIEESGLKKRIKKIVIASSKSCYGEGSYRCPEHGVFNPMQRPLDQLERKKWEVLCPQCGKESRPEAIKESKPLQNLNPYSLSKYTTEQLSLDYSYALGIDTVALRFFNIYGSRQSLSNPYTGVMAIFLSRLKNNHSPVLFEDGKQLRDYVHVEDVARIIGKSLLKGSGVYNLGTGKGTSLIDISNELASLVGKDIEPMITGDFRPGDNRHDFANNSKLKSEIGFSNFTPLKNGLEELINWSKHAEAVDKFDISEKERMKYLK